MHKTQALFLVATLACACDGAIEPRSPTDHGTGSDLMDGGPAAPDWAMDGAAPHDAAHSDADSAPPPQPLPRAPCAKGSCWENAPGIGGACGSYEVQENFKTGLYNSHRYPLSAPAGVSVTLTLSVTGGSWSPALLLLRPDGSTLYDGERAVTGGNVTLEPLDAGQGGGPAKLKVTAPTATQLHLFVTSWGVVQGDFAPAMPQDASYSLGVSTDCPPGAATCPMDKNSISKFGSGFFSVGDSMDPSSPDYNPYKRDTRDSHSGYDLHAPLDVPVVATQDGTIIEAVTTNTGLCGKSINLAVASGVTFRYCHLNSVLVTSGTVTAGQVIAKNGMTGNAHSPHIHFVYLDAPNVTGSGTTAQKSAKVNAYIDGLCK